MRTLPENPSLLAIGGREIAVDQHGYLMEPEDWDEGVAAELARRAQLELTPLHWEVIRFMRDFLAEHGVAADARFVFRFLDSRSGNAAKSGRSLFFELFPYGYTGQACKIAGMRQPRAWSTG
ncbi:MAG: TusE/DsrC/DsvC family sulfur relay protein [Rhodomicrobium sp.]